MTLAAGAEDRSARTCFVIMPYGVRDAGARRVNFDRIYESIFKPAIRRIRVDGKAMIPVRADEAQHSRLLVLSMIQDLLRSRLALADVSTPNPNVHWEVGMRHNAVRSGTVLVRLKRTGIPFDIAPVMVREYADTPPQAADASVTAIAAALRETLRRNEVDSPAFMGARHLASLMGTPQAPSDLGEAVADAELAVLRGRPAEAASLYAKVVALAPDHAVLHHRQGALLIQSGQPELAQQSFRHVIELDPAHGDALRMLADIKEGRAVPLIAPDPLEFPGLKDLLISRGSFDPNHLLASAGPRGMDISIQPGAHTRGEYQSLVRVIGDSSSNISPVSDILQRYGFASAYGALDVPETHRTIYTFNATSPSRSQLASTISGLHQDLQGVAGVAKIGVGGGFTRGGGRGGGTGGSGGFGAF